ncbi:hypothetical protein PROFUN_01553 [Planoprotostelium fungivorum]|uniref:Uncharacterized protein n=1 Tax=Planoprotostelium fungivorum TaxID=1890364 RepID=A0A2P6NTL6_9EUKA|nr:hypothetical protein PROFUN_01553 [Planoprotostelium fungivorum]
MPVTFKRERSDRNHLRIKNHSIIRIKPEAAVLNESKAVSKGWRSENSGAHSSRQAGVLSLVSVWITRNQDLRNSLLSLINGYPAPNVYNWGEHFASASEGQGKKINAVYSDALDVIFQLPLDVLLLRYKETQKNLVIGAEKNNTMPQSNLPSNIFGPDTDKKDIYRRPRWLNSGIMIGQTDHLRTLFTLTKAKWDTLIPPPLSGDQGVIAEMFYFNYESTMFQMMHWSTDDIVWDSDTNESTLANAPLAPSQFKKKIDVRGIDLDSTAGRLGWNRISNTIPAAMHFNSEEQKINLDAWWTKAWGYPRLSEILEGYANDENVGMHVNGQWMTWNETCGSYDLR